MSPELSRELAAPARPDGSDAPPAAAGVRGAAGTCDGQDAVSAVPPVTPDPSPVLMEVPGNTGLVLWQCLRDVLAWVAAPKAERAAVFGPGALTNRRARMKRADLPPELVVPVGLVVDLVGNPAGTEPLLVTRACLRIAQYLCSNGAGLSALVFAQAAALAGPGHPRSLLEVGRLLGPARAREALTYLGSAHETGRIVR